MVVPIESGGTVIQKNFVKAGMQAKENINITAAGQSNKTNTETNSSSSFAGVSVGIGTGTIGIAVNASKGKETIDENSTSYKKSTVTASDKLHITSGEDTNIIGSQISGNKVKADIGENLNIESLQETNKYEADSKSAGIGINTALGTNISNDISLSGNINKTDSDYKSVIEQAGIYAGKEGYEITVADNTDLKGAVITSEAEADKNSLTTGTLTYSDIENKAEYESKGIGISLDANKTSGNQPATEGQKGLIPSVPAKISDKAESTTKSGIAEGKITITKPEEQKQDVNKLNRNTKDTLNKLDNIFDKNKIRETQETAALFSELAFNAIHNMSKKWTKEQKIMAHMAVGYISGELTDSKTAVSVALAAGINKYVIEEISRNPKMKAYYEKNPAELQWLSAALGAAIGGIIDNDALTGANIAISGTRNNYLFIDQIEQKEKEISEAKERGASEEEISAIERKWNEIDYYQDMALDAFGYSGESIDDKQSISKEMQSDIKNHARTLYMLRHANEIAEVVGLFGQTLMQESGDNAIEKYYAENSSKNIKITPVQVNPNINMVVPIESGGTVIQKTFVKAGILQIAGTAYSIYLDAEKYTGTDLTIASGLDVGGMVVSLAASEVVLPKSRESAMTILVGGAVIGVVVDYTVNNIKKEILGE